MTTETTTRRETWYGTLIRETLARMGRLGMDVRHVEGAMRVAHGTLDALGGAAWSHAVRNAVAECADMGAEMSERVARSYGL